MRETTSPSVPRPLLFTLHPLVTSPSPLDPRGPRVIRRTIHLPPHPPTTIVLPIHLYTGSSPLPNPALQFLPSQNYRSLFVFFLFFPTHLFIFTSLFMFLVPPLPFFFFSVSLVTPLCLSLHATVTTSLSQYLHGKMSHECINNIDNTRKAAILFVHS